MLQITSEDISWQNAISSVILDKEAFFRSRVRILIPKLANTAATYNHVEGVCRHATIAKMI